MVAVSRTAVSSTIVSGAVMMGNAVRRESMLIVQLVVFSSRLCDEVLRYY